MGCWLSFPPSQVCLSQPLDQDGSQALEVQKVIRSMREELGLEPFGDLEPYSQRECPTQVNRFFWLWVEFFLLQDCQAVGAGVFNFLLFYALQSFVSESGTVTFLLINLSPFLVLFLSMPILVNLSCIQI